MLAECGRCGWTEEVDSELHAIARYTRHTLEDHPEAARTDPVVRGWLAITEAQIAKSNGRPY